MIIVSSHAYQGKNIYSYKPVVKLVVDLGRFADIPTKDIEGFNDAIQELLPGLKKHCCCKGYEGGFVERLKEGTYLAHVMEHIALELQAKLGYDIRFGKTRETGKKGIYNVIYGYENEYAGLQSGKLAFEVIEGILAGELPEVNAKLEEIKKVCIATDFGVSTAAIVREAQQKDIPVIRLGSGSILQLGYGKYQKRIEATLTENSSCVSVDIACNKELTKSILNEYGIPVPEGKVFKNEQDALEYCERIGYPVVVKPNCGSHGKGVSINLKNPQEVLEAFKIAREYEDTVLVEKYIKGSNYRVLVVGDKVAAASHRISAHVTGDGSSTLGELIMKENNNPMRGEGHEKPLTKINIDKVVEQHLRKRNITLEYVPDKGEMVYLRENDNLSTGGVAIDVTDEVHEQNKKLIALAAGIVGLDVAGVDVSTVDISRPLDETGGAIIEINAAPGIRMHHYPYKGTPRNVAKAIVDMLFPEGSKSRIPIVSVTGTNGKTTTSRMIAHIIKSMGHTVGMTTTSGIYINDELIRYGDNTGPISAKTVLMDRRVEYAVLETARGGIVNKGLGYDMADVGIVTNITEDHLGIDDINTLEDLAFVKSLAVEAVKQSGYAVLNADDQYCLSMRERIKSNIILFSLSTDNEAVNNHILNGGIAVYSNGSSIFVNKGGSELLLIEVKAIPATMNGILRHNISNSMAAIAGAIGLQIPTESIITGLSTFRCDSIGNPGRFNIHDINGIRVILDYGHNIDGYRAVIDSLKQMKAGRLIGIIGVPGDRTDSSTITIGNMCGNCFDRIYIKEDKDKRGREPGEIAALLEKGCRMGSIKSSEILIELAEEKALKKALLDAEPGDIVIVFFEEYQLLMDVIERMKLELSKIRQIIA
ncbi:MAG: cyanophycin synthetase [Gracilibacteraceae bacterium]|nr:cyanophycin synthetase [Gracilibacteraceae bacterium]